MSKSVFIKYFVMVFFLYIKTLTGYYPKNNERLWKKACERCQNLSIEVKNKKRKYGCKQYRNLFEEEKNKKHQCGPDWYINLPDDEN